MDMEEGGASCSTRGGKKRKLQDREGFKFLQCLSVDEFKSEFKIKKSTFNFICDAMREHYKNDSVEERIAIVVWKLANAKSKAEIEVKFGLGSHDNTNHLFKSTCKKIVTELKSQYLRFPEIEARYAIKKKFEEISEIPNVVGAIYTTRLKITRNRASREGTDIYSLPVQGVVDSKGIFIDVFCSDDLAGEMTDHEVLKKSDIYKYTSRYIQGHMIVGEYSLPLKDWLLVPYPMWGRVDDRALQERKFNDKISDIHRVARVAFGRLRGRWAFLDKEIDVGYKFAPEIVCLCCIFHNICEEQGDSAEEFEKPVDGDVITDLISDEQTPSAVAAREEIATKLYLYPRRD